MGLQLPHQYSLYIHLGLALSCQDLLNIINEFQNGLLGKRLIKCHQNEGQILPSIVAKLNLMMGENMTSLSPALVDQLILD